MINALAEYMHNYTFLESHITLFDFGSGEYS